MFIVYGKICMSRKDPHLEFKDHFLIFTLIGHIFPQSRFASKPNGEVYFSKEIRTARKLNEI